MRINSYSCSIHYNIFKEDITMSKQVDFNNPESVAEAIAEAETQATEATTEKAAKPKKPRKIKVTYTADRDIKAGETIEFEYELPAGTGKRGMLVGIPVEEMTDEQLKIEYRNANSVYYKQTKAGKDATKAKERLDKVLAVMEQKGIKPTGRGAATPITAAAVAELIKSGKISADEIQKLLDGSAE